MCFVNKGIKAIKAKYSVELRRGRSANFARHIVLDNINIYIAETVLLRPSSEITGANN